MKNGFNITENQCLYTILQSHEIVIPIIQRDYAQGRDNINVKSIIDNFIKDIFNSLLNNKRLKLSFIYGTEEGSQYVPYDGQQRLTLVFLLMLYLSEYSGERINELSKFSYRTRDFSVDFCRYITGDNSFFRKNNLSEISPDGEDLKNAIKNDINFFSAWANDPTVSSMINVLQTIHSLFHKIPLQEGILNKKAQATDFIGKLKEGYLFFDWCTLNASDSIYVKMNGRGKTLSAFDNFKNTLYGILNDLRNNVEIDQDKKKFLENFELKMDSTWTDLFWKYRDKFVVNNPDNIDIASAMMNFIYFAFEYKYIAQNNERFFGEGNSVRWLDENNVISFISKFKSAFSEKKPTIDENKLTIDDYIWLSKILDILSERLQDRNNDLLVKKGDKELINEKGLFISLCKKDSNYEKLFTAALYYSYLAKASKFNTDGSLKEILDTHKEDWADFICNINKTVQFFNSHFNELVYDKKVYVVIRELIKKVSDDGNLVSSVANITRDEVTEWRKHFTLHADYQLQEEYEKLQLRNENSSWNEVIAEANNIPYFNGQIYFLIDISKDNSGKVDIETFKKYMKATRKLITTDKNNKPILFDDILRRILLSFGDYRINSGEQYGNAKSLCQSTLPGTAVYFLWRSFFDVLHSKKTNFIKQLLDEIIKNDYDIDKTLESREYYISEHFDNSWRHIIIRYPEILTRIGAFGIFEDPYIITADGAKKRVRSEHKESAAINIYLYGLYRSLGYTFDSENSIPINLQNKWKLPSNQTIEYVSPNNFRLSENNNVIVEWTFEKILQKATPNAAQ